MPELAVMAIMSVMAVMAAMVILTLMVIMAGMAIIAILPFLTFLDCLKSLETWPRKIVQVFVLLVILFFRQSLNKVNSFSNQIQFIWAYKFRVDLDIIVTLDNI